MTDSNSGITQEQGRELGVYVVPMPFTINDKEYFEDISLTQPEFYEYLKQDADVVTSQPAPIDVMNLWEGLLEQYDAIVHIPMSSGLSGACSTARVLAEDYDGRVAVVNNQRVSVTQRQSVLDAYNLAKNGKSHTEIKEILERVKMESHIYITLDTLQYLRKGGRITPAAAALGEILRLKPVLQIRGEKLDAFAKARNIRQAKQLMINAIKKDMEDNYGGIRHEDEEKQVWIGIAHTDNYELAQEFKSEVVETFPGYDIHIDPLSLSIACHIGPGALALACSHKIS